MRINGTLFTFVKSTEGYDIVANGAWVGWSAGNLTDAKNTACEIARSMA